MKYLITLIIAAMMGPMAKSSELVSLKDFLKGGLAGAPKLTKETFTLDSAQSKALKNLAENADDKSFTFYFGRSKSDELSRVCLVVPQKGKEGPLSIGVCYDSDGMITDVTVLASEEIRGQKVAEEEFLKQFNGKSISSAFQVGKDINGVSGATISSLSVAEALRKSAYAFKTFVRSKK